jgi:hypothetical protein
MYRRKIGMRNREYDKKLSIGSLNIEVQIYRDRRR